MIITKDKAEFINFLSTKGKILGIDFGAKKTGLAISDEYRRLSSPLTVIETIKINDLYQIIVSQEVVGIVVGWPIEMKGSEGKECARVLEITEKLFKKTKLPIYLVDERLSTREALTYLSSTNFNRKKKQQIDDMISANILLSSFLR